MGMRFLRTCYMESQNGGGWRGPLKMIYSSLKQVLLEQAGQDGTSAGFGWLQRRRLLSEVSIYPDRLQWMSCFIWNLTRFSFRLRRVTFFFFAVILIQIITVITLFIFTSCLKRELLEPLKLCRSGSGKREIALTFECSIWGSRLKHQVLQAQEPKKVQSGGV